MVSLTVLIGQAKRKKILKYQKFHQSHSKKVMVISFLKMNGDYLEAYQQFCDHSEKIKKTRISKVSYLLKLNAQRNSLSDLDRKHKAW